MRALLFVAVVYLTNRSGCGSRTFGLDNPKPLLREPTFTADEANLTTAFFQQTLDHTNPNDERTWQQKYYVNEQFANGKKDVAFILISGEQDAASIWMTVGGWIDIAKKQNATLFQLEHRYYGESHPTSDLSNENLQYLSPQQALADLANFIKSMNVKYKFSSKVKWVAFGNSYAGSLAAWFRQGYPDVVHGAVSMSAPLLIKLNFKEFYTLMVEDLRNYGAGNGQGEKCVSAVKDSFSQLDALIKNADGQREVDKLFKLCDTITEAPNDSENITNIFSLLTSNFASVAMFTRVPIDGLPDNANTTDKLCEIMLNTTIGTEVNRLATINDLFLVEQNARCLDYRQDTFVAYLRNVSLKNGNDRQWRYQQCSEFGTFVTSDAEPHIFGDKLPLAAFIKGCADVFGSSYNLTSISNRVEATNKLFRGLDNNATNVVYYQGTSDPWRGVGLTETRDKRAPVILVEGGGHGAVLYPPADNDTPQLKAARKQIDEIVASWLG